MKASERQVGGAHYRIKPGGVGHWDYCVEVNVPYLEGCASKYLTRWRDKNGVQDLEKSLHYIERRLEAIHTYKGALRGANKDKKMFIQFIADNNIPDKEAEIIDQVMHWKRPDYLFAAIGAITSLIEQAKIEESGPTSSYVNQDR